MSLYYGYYKQERLARALKAHRVDGLDKHAPVVEDDVHGGCVGDINGSLPCDRPYKRYDVCPSPVESCGSGQSAYQWYSGLCSRIQCDQRQPIQPRGGHIGARRRLNILGGTVIILCISVS